MRAMWRGEISFGLVMIPIRLYTATEHRDVAFRQVHRVDGGRIKFRRVCSVCGEEVPYSDVAKGYELPDGEMVVLTDDDLGELPLPTTHNIEVVQFAPAEQVDPIMWERSYYAEPDPKGVRAYALLRDALERSGKVAVARVALRQRETLAALRTRDDVLVLSTLLWPDEIREPDFEFLDSDVDVRPQELTMATSLIDSMTVDFDPSQFSDNYREALEELVQAKIEGHEVAQPTPLREETAMPSLADALRASLEAAGAGPSEKPASATRSAASRKPSASSGKSAGSSRKSAAPSPVTSTSTRTRKTAAAMAEATSTDGPGTKRGTAKGGAARDGAAKGGTGKGGTAKGGAARDGAARDGAAKGGTAKGGAAKDATGTPTTTARKSQPKRTALGEQDRRSASQRSASQRSA